MKKFVLSLIVVSVAFVSCQKDTEDENQHSFTAERGLPIAELNVTSDFDWKTNQEVQFDLKTEKDAVVAIQSQVDGGVYEKGFIKANSRYTSKITLPKGTEKIYLNFNNQVKEVILTSNKVEYTFQ